MSRSGKKAGGGDGHKGGVFEDYQFRFANTYTAVDDDAKRQKNTAQRVAPPNLLTTSPATMLSCQPSSSAKKKTEEEEVFYLHRVKPKRRVDSIDLVEDGLNTVSTKNDIEKGIGGRASACVIPATITISDGLVYTNQYIAQLREQEEQQRRLRTKTTAESLLKYSRARKPNSMPLFRGAQPTRSGAEGGGGEVVLDAIGVESFMPVHRPLPAPALGLAAGIDIINGDSDLYAMTMAEKDAVRDSEKSRNERLFKWWENRQSARMLQYDREVLEKAIEGPLMDSVRELITSAESEWIEDYCRQQRNSIAAHPPRSGGPPTSSLMSGDGAAPRATGTDIMAQGSGISPVGATTRGVIVPINELETLFRNMRAHLHQRATALLVTYNESKAVEGHHADGEGGSLEASFAGILAGGRPRTDSTTKEVERVGLQHDVNRAMEVYISHFVETEKELTASAAEGLLPSTVSLPPERILPSALIIETATSAALLWKILSQVRTVVPGIDFALQLYHHYLLPHLYEGVVPYLSVLPDLGGISEQVAQLTQIPLRSQVSQWASEAAIQSKEDLRYMEHAMKHWAMRTWRRSVIAKRQAQIRNRSLTSLISRLRNQSLIRTVFDAWRFHTREDARTNYFRMIDQKYQLFLADSEVASRINAAGMMNPLSTHVGDVALGDKNKFIATKLAEAARHVKVQVKGHASIHEESISRRESAIASATLRSSIVDPLILTGGHSANRRTNSTDGSSPFLPAPPPRIGDLTPRQTNLEFLSTIGSKGGASIPSLPTQPSPTMMVAHRGSTATTKAGGSISGPPLALPPVPVPPHGNASSRPSSGVSAYTLENSANTMDLGEDHSMLAFQSVPQFTRSDMHETRATGTFEDMLAKLKDMEEVCGHLRQEIAVQTRMLQKVETEKRGLQEHNRKLEADLLKTVEEKLHFCNLVQQKQFLLNDRHRRILQLKSRIRSHRNRPWQRTLLRVVGELSGVNTHVAELLDDARVQRDVGSDGSLDSKSGEKGGEDKKAANLEYTTQHLREEEELRLFGSLAPIVLSSTRNLPDALQILQDWANGCLSDLQSLDDLKGGALSVQFSTFSEEARNGILLSRLLFYLALPRYLQRTANSDHMQQNAESSIVLKTVAEGEGGTAQAGEFPDRRRQLLEKRNVQLDSPFPVYSDCFGDLLNMMPSERMSLLLQFATELMAGTEVSISDSIDLKRKEAQDAVLAELDLSPPAPAARVELQEVIDPHALSMGERSAVVTFVALLYTRFSHPFNHKCRQSAEIEREAIIYLLSEGQSLQDRASARRHSSSRGSTEFTSADTERERRLLSTVEEEIMAHLEDEDKSPWQLFKERCIPVFGTNAHPFLLRGNFWPSDAFDSPQLAEVLGELGMALNRSLQLHRWHVTISCLVPVMTYAGISRGIFTGPRASPNALRVGLVRDDQWQLPLHGSCLSRIFQKRATLLRAAMQSGIFAAADVLAAPTRLVPDSESGGFVVEDTPLAVIPPTWCIDPEQIPVEEFVLREKAALMLALRNVSHDLLALFLRRSVLSAELALPTLDLGGWRLLCADLKLITMVPEEEEHYPLDMEAITIFFYDAVMSQGEWERPTSFTTNSTLASPRGGRSRNNPAAGGGGALSGSRGGTPPASSTILSETSGMVVAPLPTIRSDMAFPAFVTAVVLVANALYQLTNRDGQSSHGNNNNNKDAGDGAGAGGEAGSEVDLGSTVNSLQRSTELRPSSGRRTTNTTQRDGSADGSPRHHPGSPNPPSRKKVLRSYFDEDMPRPMKTRSILWAGDALMRFVCTRVGDATDTGRGDDPQSLAKRITRGIATQETLSWYTPALIVAFNAYSKDIFGSSGMEKEDLLRMLRDAMLTSTEISQYLIYELFQHCCVTRRAIEEEATAKRREIDGRPRDEPNKGRRNLRAVSIVDPRTNMVSSSQRKDVQILVYEGFVQFLCVLCYFKQPNPLIPFDQRLSVFLRRSLLRPLSHKVENLSQMLNRSKMAKELQQEDESSAAADGKPLRRGGAATAKM